MSSKAKEANNDDDDDEEQQEAAGNWMWAVDVSRATCDFWDLVQVPWKDLGMQEERSN